MTRSRIHQTLLDHTSRPLLTRESKQHGGCPSISLYFPGKCCSDILSTILMSTSINIPTPGHSPAEVLRMQMANMHQSFTDTITQHWVIGGIAASLIWFLAGKQSLSNGKPNAALGWQSVAVFVMLVGLGWMLAEGEWLGIVCSIGVLCLELWSIRKTLAVRSANRQVANL